MAHQPNFVVLTDALRTISDQMQLMPNLPAMDQHQRYQELSDKLDSVLTELRSLRNDWGTVQATMSTQATVGTLQATVSTLQASVGTLQASIDMHEQRSSARALNSLVRGDGALTPLRTADGAAPAHFPATK